MRVPPYRALMVFFAAHVLGNNIQAVTESNGHVDGVVNTTTTLPHILFYLTDDMGWNLINFGGNKPHNTEVFTPTLTELAENGVVLERHYAYVLMLFCVSIGFFCKQQRVLASCSYSELGLAAQVSLLQSVSRVVVFWKIAHPYDRNES